MQYQGKFYSLEIHICLLVVNMWLDWFVDDFLFSLEQVWSLFLLERLLDDTMSFLQILGDLVCTLFDQFWGYFSLRLFSI